MEVLFDLVTKHYKPIVLEMKNKAFEKMNNTVEDENEKQISKKYFLLLEDLYISIGDFLSCEIKEKKMQKPHFINDTFSELSDRCNCVIYFHENIGKTQECSDLLACHHKAVKLFERCS